MKKILLIITITLCIFQMVILAVDIDIGSPAINRGSGWYTTTFVEKANPANETGTITSVEIWAVSNLSNCEVAIFYVVSGDNLSTRSTHAIGSVTSGSKQTFGGLSLEVHAGDYIGLYSSSGGLEKDFTGGVGNWYLSGDHIPCSNETFTYAASYACSIYGTGTTEVGWDHKWDTKTISKWNTKEFTKWNGIE